MIARIAKIHVALAVAFCMVGCAGSVGRLETPLDLRAATEVQDTNPATPGGDKALALATQARGLLASATPEERRALLATGAGQAFADGRSSGAAASSADAPSDAGVIARLQAMGRASPIRAERIELTARVEEPSKRAAEPRPADDRLPGEAALPPPRLDPPLAEAHASAPPEPRTMPARRARTATLLRYFPGETQPSREALEAFAAALKPHAESVGVTIELVAGISGSATVADTLVANRRLRTLAAHVTPHMAVDRRFDPALPPDTIEISVRPSS